MRRVIDMQLYPQITPQWERLTKTSFEELTAACGHYARQFTGLSIESGLMLLLNPDFLKKEENVRRFREWRRSEAALFAFGCLLNFRERRSFELLEIARDLGFVTLKVYPYLQEVEDKDFEGVVPLAQKAESLGMYLTICCSYGTRALDRYNGVRLAAFLSEKVKCPIVMAHAGGAKLLDAFLVAEAAPHVFLDISFSLPYYRGSSLEQDFSFAMKKLGTHRWMYGSDAPYMALEDSLKTTLAFLDKYGFTADQAEEILYKTAKGLLHG